MTESPDPLAFTPVPGRARRDGWTPARQRDFVAALRATGLVGRAAAAVGMSRKSAYALRERAGEDSSFARCWDAAVERCVDRALADSLPLALEGVEVPVFYGGRQIASYRRHDTRLALAVLRAYAARRGFDDEQQLFTRAVDRQSPSPRRNSR